MPRTLPFLALLLVVYVLAMEVQDLRANLELWESADWEPTNMIEGADTTTIPIPFESGSFRKVFWQECQVRTFVVTPDSASVVAWCPS